MDQGTFQLWEVIGVWFSGFATFLAVVLALVLQRRYEHARRPKLTVAYETNHSGDNRYLPRGRAGNTNDREELWIRLRVENTSRVIAQDVEVRLISIRRERRDREDRSSRWFKVSHLDRITIAIPPEFTQYFDLGFITNKPDSPTDISFDLAALNPPLLEWDREKARIEESGVNRVEIGFKYDVAFAVVSGNADATYFKICLKVVPKEDGDPTSACGEHYLRNRIEVSNLEPISAREAFSP